MPISRKKVIVRKLNRDLVCGYLPPANFIAQGEIRVLALDGKVTSVRAAEVKWVCFVRDFNSGEPGNPERLVSKTFLRRPRSQGLWLRTRLQDDDLIEGLAQNDLSLLDQNGIFLIPPDSRANTQRIFLPRSAIKELEIVAAVRTVPAKPAQESVQGTLFKL